MKTILKMAGMNVLLSYRIKIAFFFTFIFPMGFFFIYCGLFAKGNPTMVAGVMGPLISLSVISSSLFGLSVQLVTMRERDMLRRYHLAPITATQMIASRLLSNYLLFIPVVALQFVLAVLIYHMPLHASVFGLWVVYTLGYMALGALGLVVAGIVNTVQEATVWNQILFFALLFLSGTTVPINELTGGLQHLALFLPPTLMILASEGMMMAGQSPWQHWPEMLGLALTAVGALGLAIALFRWEKEERVTRRGRLQALLAVIPIIVVGVWLNMSASFKYNNRFTLTAMSNHGQSTDAQPISPDQIPKP